MKRFMLQSRIDQLTTDIDMLKKARDAVIHELDMLPVEPRDAMFTKHGLLYRDRLICTKQFIQLKHINRYVPFNYTHGKIIQLLNIREDGDNYLCTVGELNGGAIGGVPLDIVLEMRKEYLASNQPKDATE